MKPRLNHLQAYLAQEFVDEYHQGRMTRRELLARVLGMAGGIASAAAILAAMGCEPATPTPKPPAPATATPQPPAPTPAPAPATPPKPTPATPTPPPAAAPPSRSKLSVRPDDPGITAADVTFPDGGTTLMGYLVQPKTGGPFPAVLVCHENRGLVEHIRDVARRLGKAGYAALALDLLSRDGGTAKVDPAQVPGKLTADPARNVSDFQAAFRHLQTLTSVQKANIGMIGFCFGGGMTWLVVTAIPELKAAVEGLGRVASSSGEYHVGARAVKACILAEVYGLDANANRGSRSVGGSCSAAPAYELAYQEVTFGLSQRLVSFQYLQGKSLQVFEGQARVDAYVFQGPVEAVQVLTQTVDPAIEGPFHVVYHVAGAESPVRYVDLTFTIWHKPAVEIGDVLGHRSPPPAGYGLQEVPDYVQSVRQGFPAGHPAWPGTCRHAITKMCVDSNHLPA